MCLAIPARVAFVEGRGQYVLVHAGIALRVLDEAEAEETLALIREALGDE
ncbi:MAG TPA: HypC/HybG/HupF family hydrogenase formation chaperone [Symbiobacteriaceae bacterium]|nr:HypC/HybG/HupF family hydrogenase formation chaperone [Symbiobacteriaceae bacterium]